MQNFPSVQAGSRIAPFTGGSAGSVWNNAKEGRMTSDAAIHNAEQLALGTYYVQRKADADSIIVSPSDMGRFADDPRRTANFAVGLVLQAVIDSLGAFLVLADSVERDETLTYQEVTFTRHAIAMTAIQHPGPQTRQYPTQRSRYQAPFITAAGSIDIDNSITRTAESGLTTGGAINSRRHIESVLTSLIQSLILHIFNGVMQLMHDGNVVYQLDDCPGIMSGVNGPEALLEHLTAYRTRVLNVNSQLDGLNSLHMVLPSTFNLNGSSIMTSDNIQTESLSRLSQMIKSTEFRTGPGIRVTATMFPAAIATGHVLDSLNVSYVPPVALSQSHFNLPDKNGSMHLVASLRDALEAQDALGEEDIDEIALQITTRGTKIQRRLCEFLSKNDRGFDGTPFEKVRAFFAEVAGVEESEEGTEMDSMKLLKACCDIGFPFCEVLVVSLSQFEGQNIYVLTNGVKFTYIWRPTIVDSQKNTKFDTKTFAVLHSFAIAPPPTIEAYTVRDAVITKAHDAPDAVISYKYVTANPQDPLDIDQQVFGCINQNFNNVGFGRNIRFVMLFHPDSSLEKYKAFHESLLPKGDVALAGPQTVLTRLHQTYPADVNKALNTQVTRLPVSWERDGVAAALAVSNNSPFSLIKNKLSLSKAIVTSGSTHSTGELF